MQNTDLNCLISHQPITDFFVFFARRLKKTCLYLLPFIKRSDELHFRTFNSDDDLYSSADRIRLLRKKTVPLFSPSAWEAPKRKWWIVGVQESNLIDLLTWPADSRQCRARVNNNTYTGRSKRHRRYVELDINPQRWRFRAFARFWLIRRAPSSKSPVITETPTTLTGPDDPREHPC